MYYFIAHRKQFVERAARDFKLGPREYKWLYEAQNFFGMPRDISVIFADEPSYHPSELECERMQEIEMQCAARDIEIVEYTL